MQLYCISFVDISSGFSAETNVYSIRLMLWIQWRALVCCCSR